MNAAVLRSRRTLFMVNLPVGSDQIEQWAFKRRLQYKPRPDLKWFREWEPFDTISSPVLYFNAVSWQASPGSLTLAEPWTEEGLNEPMDRTVLGFASHPELRWRASMHSGEHFITRVTFLTDKPLPEQSLGDPVWDEQCVTRAISAEHARAAFTTALRNLLRSAGFAGHIEMRPQGLMLHVADLKPTAASYEQLSHMLPQVVTAALTPG